MVDTTGTRTFNYNLAGTLELQNEDLPSFFGSRRVSYPRASSGVIGRQTGLQLGTSGSPTSEQNATWGYDTYGRFNSLAGGGTTLAYSYTSNSNLLASIADSTSGWTQTRSYLSNRDLLDVIETKVSTATKGKFDYAHDNLGRRTAVAKTGELYARYGNGTQGLDTTWGYDDRSQLTSEVTKLGGSGTVLTGRDDAYSYDNIGNRSSTAGTTHNSNTASYATNALNQYTQRTVPGVFDVAGAAGSGTTVTVNGSSSGVTRHGEYFFKGQSMANNPNPVFSTLAVSDGTTTTNIAAFLAGTPESFTYDDDGQLLSDGRWDYTWNGESQLVAVQTHTALSPSPLPNADARRVEFKYDYQGRRVQKTVRAGWNGSVFTTVVSDEKFVHHGQAIIAKLDAANSNALVASYYWGLDWSGSLQGAGGVGGLALTVEDSNTYLPMFDGNGNNMGMIKASNGSLEAAYEYDAFGNTIRESGTYAAANAWRFATKYADTETGLVQHNFRYYSPTLGRFLGRDPLGEQGGLNLYAYCGNNGINRWDYLGLTVTVTQYVDDGEYSDDAIRQYHPNWQNIGLGLWHDPDSDTNYFYTYRPPNLYDDDGAPDPSASWRLMSLSAQIAGMNEIFNNFNSAMATWPGAPKTKTSVTLGPLIFEGYVQEKPSPKTPAENPKAPSSGLDLSLRGISQILGNTGPRPGPGQLANLGQYALATVDPRTGATTLLVSSDGGPIYAPASYNAAANVAAADASWNPAWYRRQVQGGGPWDYKQMDPSYEHLGNFNYGLTGAAFGFTDGQLLRNAGAAQISAGTSNPAYGTSGSTWFGVGGSGSFGDDPRDQTDIRLGISTHDNNSTVTTVRTGYFGPPGG